MEAVFVLPVLTWLAFAGLITWWANEWGRDPGWALIGSLLLSPLAWAIVLMVLGRVEEDATPTVRGPSPAPRTAQTRTQRVVALPKGVATCDSCRRLFSPSSEQWEAGVAYCPQCRSRVTLREVTRVAESEPSGRVEPAIVRNPATPHAFAVCPQCASDAPVTFDDAKAGKVTCPGCWRSFVISAE